MKQIKLISLFALLNLTGSVLGAGDEGFHKQAFVLYSKAWIDNIKDHAQVNSIQEYLEKYGQINTNFPDLDTRCIEFFPVHRPGNSKTLVEGKNAPHFVLFCQQESYMFRKMLMMI